MSSFFEGGFFFFLLNYFDRFLKLLISHYLATLYMSVLPSFMSLLNVHKSGFW